MRARPRIADLFCGAGGAAMGLHRAGFEVVGFDIKPQPHYPFEFHEGDALTVDLSGFDAVWASPPCQAYVNSRFRWNMRKGKKWDSIPPTRAVVDNAGKPYIIENVPGAPLQNWMILCGTMFQGLRVLRHRWFECSWGIPFPPQNCFHNGTVSRGDYAAVYGRGARGSRRGRGSDGERLRDAVPDRDAPPWGEAMGIAWMTDDELAQAIPPAFSEYLGRQLMKTLQT